MTIQGKNKQVYSTCAIETHSESILCLKDKIQYQVWDFAGQPEYSTIHQVGIQTYHKKIVTLFCSIFSHTWMPFI